MKKFLLAIWSSFMMVASAQAIDKIAIVNMNNLFQQIAERTGVSEKLETEFKSRAKELQHIENDLQRKIQRLQRDSSIMKIEEKNRLKKELIFQRQNFSQKAQAFEQIRQKRSNEERDKLIAHIQTILKKFANDESIDLILDTNIVAFHNSDVKDITPDILKQVKQ